MTYMKSFLGITYFKYFMEILRWNNKYCYFKENDFVDISILVYLTSNVWIILNYTILKLIS